MIKLKDRHDKNRKKTDVWQGYQEMYIDNLLVEIESMMVEIQVAKSKICC